MKNVSCLVSSLICVVVFSNWHMFAHSFGYKIWLKWKERIQKFYFFMLLCFDEEKILCERGRKWKNWGDERGEIRGGKIVRMRTIGEWKFSSIPVFICWDNKMKSISSIKRVERWIITFDCIFVYIKSIHSTRTSDERYDVMLDLIHYDDGLNYELISTKCSKKTLSFCYLFVCLTTADMKNSEFLFVWSVDGRFFSVEIK
jgi:hypothetical protein